MKISLHFPAYNKAIYFGPTLDSWFQFDNLPDEIIITENHTPVIKPEDRLLPVIQEYRWPEGIDVRYFQRNTILREMYPNFTKALKAMAVKHNGLIPETKIADAWYEGRTLIGNGASNKNFGARVATGDILISSDPENIETVDVIDIVRRRLKLGTAIYAHSIYQVEPITGEVQKLAFEKKPYWYTVAMHRQDYLAVGGLPETFDSEWGWEDEAFALALKRHKIKVVYPPRLIVHHQNHLPKTGKVFVNHNEEAKKQYNEMPPKKPWVNNEVYGHKDWGSAIGWNEISLNLKRSS